MPVKKIKTAKKTVAVKNRGKLTMIPLRSWILFWFFVVATMTLVIVCFTSAFRSIDRDANRETAAAFQVIRQNLEAQVAELQAQVGVTNTQELSYADFSDRIEGECLSPQGGSVDTSKALLTYVTYTDPKTSVSMILPYSFGWGTINCPPVQTHPEGEILFGPSRRGEGGAGRESSISIEAPSSTAAIRALAVSVVMQSELENKTIRQRTVNGLTVLSYSYSGGMASGNVWVAVGRTHVYWIYSAGWLTDAEAIKIIQSLKVVK